MYLPTNPNIPWRPEDVLIQAKNGFVMNKNQAEWLKQLIKRLNALYREIANVVNKNAGFAPLLLDGVHGRVFRSSTLRITDGTNANTIRCKLEDDWNGDSTSWVDNIAKDNNDYSGYSLNIPGTDLVIDKSILSGNVMWAKAFMVANNTGDAGLFPTPSIVFGGVGLDEQSIDLEIQTFTGGMAAQDMTALVDLGIVYVDIIYITDA